MHKIAFIGSGSMGMAIARGISSKRLYQPEEIILCGRDQAKLAQKEEDFGFDTSTSIQATISSLASDGILIFAVKPQQIDEILKEIKKPPESITVVSVLAGTKIEKFETAFPANPIFRVMPNTPSQILEGASGIAANSNTNQESKEKILNIFASIGEAVEVEEKDMDAVTALAGSGPAYYFLMVEAMIDAGIKLGLEKDIAAKLARQTIYGAAALMKETGDDVIDLRAKVTSPNGTTHAGCQSFEDQGIREIVEKALSAASDRSIELAK